MGIFRETGSGKRRPGAGHESHQTREIKMRNLLSIWIVIVLLGLLFVSLINLEEYGASGLILAGVSAFALYKVFKYVFEDDDPDEGRGYSPSTAYKPCSKHDPLHYIFYSDINDESDSDE